MEGLKQEGILSAGFSSQSEGSSEEMRFQLCKARKTLLTLSICKQDLSRFRTFFFVYYLNSLLCVCFLYWQHFLSWVSVVCWKERQRKGKGERKRGRGRQGGKGERRRQNSNNTVRGHVLLKDSLCLKWSLFFLPKNKPMTFCFLQTICIFATSRVPRYTRQCESWGLSGPGPRS